MSERVPRVAASVCAALGLLAAVGGCASADGEPPVQLRLTVPKVFFLRPPDAPHAPADSRPFRVSTDGDPGTAAGRRPGGKPWGRLTLDARGLKGVARLRQRGSRCTGGAARLACPVDAGGDDWADRYGLKPVAAAHSRVGDSGVLRYRLTTADGATRTAASRVVVGEPVLELKRPEVVKAAPGGRVSLPLTVRNTGDVPVDGVGIGIDAGAETPRQRFHDCHYPASHHGHMAVCTFPHVRIAPGETVTFTPDLSFTAPDRQLRSAIRMAVWPLALGPRPGDGWPPDGAPGDGPDLRVHRVSGAGPGPGTFTGARWISTDVELTTHADFAAVGATVHGVPGTTHRIRIGVRNDGPGELAPHHEVRFVFTVPEGSSVVRQPTQQIDDDSRLPLCDHGFDDEGRDTYTCPLEGTAAGATRTVDFTLRVTHPGTGRVRFAPPAHTDPHPSNDTAPVTVTH